MKIQEWLNWDMDRWRSYQVSMRKCLWEIKSHYHGPLVDPLIQEKGIKIRWNFRNTYYADTINPSLCDVEILPKRNGCYVIIFTELENNTGNSAINNFEDLATALYHERLRYVPVTNLEWVSHYKKDGLREHFSQVKMEWDGQAFLNPQWGFAEPEEVYAETRLLNVLTGVHS